MKDLTPIIEKYLSQEKIILREGKQEKNLTIDKSESGTFKTIASKFQSSNDEASRNNCIFGAVLLLAGILTNDKSLSAIGKKIGTSSS